MDHDKRGLPLAQLLDLLAMLGVVSASAMYLTSKHGHFYYMDDYVERRLYE